MALGLDDSIDSSTYNGLEEFGSDPTGPGAMFYKVTPLIIRVSALASQLPGFGSQKWHV